MKMKTIPLAALAATAVLGSTTQSQGAEITYSSYTATGASDTSWVIPPGFSSVAAINYGGDATGFGGVTWQDGTDAGGWTTGNTALGGGLQSNYSIPGVAWGNNAPAFYGGGPDLLHAGSYLGSGSEIYIGGLTVGTHYLIQFVFADNRTDPDIVGRTVALSPVAGVTGSFAPTQYAYSDGRFLVVTADFVADNGTIKVAPATANTSSEARGGQINGLHILQVSEPFADGSWTSTASGNWSTPSNWLSNGVANGPDNTATFSAGTGSESITVTLDGYRTIGNLAFSNANYTLTGADTLTLNASGTPAISVGTGLTATINTNLAGTLGVAKTGAGLLVLTAANSYTGATLIDEGTLALQNSYASSAFTIASGAVLELNVDSGLRDYATATFSGAGTLRKTGTGGAVWGPSTATIALGAGSQIDVQGGTLTFGSYANDSMSGSLADLHVAAGATFESAACDAYVNALTGAGTVILAYTNAYPRTMTVGVNNGGGTFSGTIIDGYNGGNGNLVKTGTGTQTLTGVNTYTGTTTVEAGTLSLGDGTNPTNLSDYATVSIAFGTTVNLNFSGTDVVGKLIIDGETLSGGTFNATTHPDYFTGSGSLTVLNQSGIWTSSASGNWNSSSNWQSNVIATGADKTATFSAGTGSESIAVTLDTARSIGNLAFSNANYTITGTSTLTFESSGTPAIGVAAGLSATINSKLASSLEVAKTGDGTLHLYTGAGDNYSGTYNHSLGGMDVQQGTVSLDSEFIRLGPINIASGATLTATHPWATGSSNPWFNGRSAGSITVQAGGTLTTTVGINAIMEGLTLLGGSVTAPGIVNGDWGGFIINSTVTADGNATSTISAELAIVGNPSLDVLSGSTLGITGAMHHRFAGGVSGIAKTGEGLLVLGGINTYTGNTTVDSGSLVLADDSQLKFVVDDSPAANMVTGTGSATFNGDFNIDTAAVSGITGHIWLLVDLASLDPATSFTSTFSVIGFTDPEDDGIWTMTDAKGDWSFDESTGELMLDVGNDYDDWKSANGVIGGENDDDDNDGLTNHEEYAFGLDPTGGSSVNPITAQLDKTTGKFTYTRRDPSLTGLTYTVWYSTDLATWTEDTGATEGTPVLSDEVETVEITLTPALLSNTKLFVQVRTN